MFRCFQGSFNLFASGWAAWAILFVEYKLVYLNNSLSPTKLLNLIWMLVCLLIVLAYQVFSFKKFFFAFKLNPYF